MSVQTTLAGVTTVKDITKIERKGAHSHIHGLGLNSQFIPSEKGDGLIGQLKARKALGVILKMLQTDKPGDSIKLSYNSFSILFFQLELLKKSYVLSRFSDLLVNKKLQLDAIDLRLASVSPLNKLNEYLKLADSLSLRLGLLNLDSKIDEKIEYINVINTNLNKALGQIVDNNEKNIDGMINKLILLNPLNILSKGYSLTYLEDKLVKSVNDVNENDEINIKVSDGNIKAIVKGATDGRK